MAQPWQAEFIDGPAEGQKRMYVPAERPRDRIVLARPIRMSVDGWSFQSEDYPVKIEEGDYILIGTYRNRAFYVWTGWRG